MSSYYPSFSYMAPNGVKYNSYKDKKLITVHFESGDSGEVDTFLSMDPIYTDNAYGTKRLDYGAKYSDVAVIRISVMKADGSDFSVPEVRDFLRWTTGSRKISYLDLSDIVDDEEIVRFSFLGRVTAVYQQKLDARTVGFVIEHTSVSPYAYSPVQYEICSFGQDLYIYDDGVLVQDGQVLSVDGNNVLNNGSSAKFDLNNIGVVYLDNSVHININNESDDLSAYVGLDTNFTSNTSDYVMIKNNTLYEESDGVDGLTEIYGVHNGESVTLSAEQFVASSKGRLMGNKFNFIWPKLMPGINNIVISGSGEGDVDFSYRYPVKIGDCAIDLDESWGKVYCDLKR